MDFSPSHIVYGIKSWILRRIPAISKSSNRKIGLTKTLKNLNRKIGVAKPLKILTVRFTKLLKTLRVRRLDAKPVSQIRSFPFVQSKNAQERILSIGFLFCAGIIGFWANESAKMEAIQKWNREHPLPVSVIDHTFASYGFSRVQDPQLLHKVIRTVPTHLDEQDTFWLSNDLSWLVHFGDQTQTIQAQVYRFREAPSIYQQKWTPFGVGWIAFEQVVAALRKKQLESKPSNSMRRNSTRNGDRPWDPREIIY